jgi:uncharacterized protein
VPRPFIKKFADRGSYFLYDVNSNGIMEVNEKLYNLIDHAVIATDSDVPAQLDSGLPTEDSDETAQVIEEINRARREHSVFSPRTPVQMAFPVSAKGLVLAFENLLSHMILNITEDCNQRCSYCKFGGTYHHARTHSRREMDESTAHQAIQFLVKHSSHIRERSSGRITLGFYGGEPSLKTSLIRKCVDDLRRQLGNDRDRASFSVTSNFSAANEEFLRLLVDNRFSVLVSLDGPKLLHDRYRHTADSHPTFDKIFSNLRKLHEMAPQYYLDHVGFSVVLAPPYDLPSIVNFFATEPLVADHRFSMSTIDDDDTCFFERFEALHEINQDYKRQKADLVDRFVSLALEGGESSEYRAILPFFRERMLDIANRRPGPGSEVMYPNGVCAPGIQRLFVSSQGTLHLCEKVGYDLPIGSIESGIDVVAVTRMMDEYIAVSEEACRACWAQRFCKLCTVNALRAGSFNPERKSGQCGATRSGILEAMKMYTYLMKRDAGTVEKLFKTTPEGEPQGLDLVFRFLYERGESAELLDLTK